jgi:hypothetical protein
MKFLDNTYLNPPHSLGLLWTSERPATDSTQQSRETDSKPRRDSHPKSQQESGRILTPWAAQPPGSVRRLLTTKKTHLSGKCRHLIFYVIILQHISVLTESSKGNLQFSKEVKHPKTVFAYTLIDVVYIIGHIKYKQYYTDTERQLDDQEEISTHLKMYVQACSHSGVCRLCIHFLICS